MTIKKNLISTIVACTLVSSMGIIAFASDKDIEPIETAYSSIMPTFDIQADEAISGIGIRQVGEEYINDFYYFNMKAGQTFSVTWDPENRYNSGDFEVGLIDENGNKITMPNRLGEISNETETITVSNSGKYRFYCRGDKANMDDGQVYFHFVLIFN